jgi:hypothetical protein
MEHRSVSYRDALTHPHREAAVSVRDHPVLKVAPDAHGDGVPISTQHGAVPDADVLCEAYCTDQHCARGNPGRPGYPWHRTFEIDQ